MNDRILNYLSLARKAGRLTPGFAASKESVLKGKAHLVIVASDISAKSEKEIRFFSGEKVPVTRIQSTIFEVTSAIGTKAGIVAVCDQGFADAIIKLL